jgi:cyclopropane-fatty-acyl-phospholipid synthase
LARLEGLDGGRLRIVEGECTWSFGSGDGPDVTLIVRDDRFWRAAALGGPVGAAEAYMDGLWTCDDLVGLVRLISRNAGTGQRLLGGLARLSHPARRVWHALRRNTRRGSRRNIADHYDLGNDFFALFLDPGLTYSSAIFETEDQSLQDAQTTKYERLCQKLRLGPEDHVLEIGTGWGGFALHAAGRHGCRVTTTTISREQYELAAERVARAGLADRVELLLEDYRELRGRFDRLVSIEMIEAVGHKHLPGFFRVCADRLKSNGAMALQAILARDYHWRQSIRSVDFIKRYIFPGGQLVSLLAITRAIARETDLRISHVEEITPHYAETLRRWRERFHQNERAVAALGLDERFRAMWDYYLAYCEGAFRERVNGVAQLVLEKSSSRQPALLGGLEGAASS